MGSLFSREETTILCIVEVIRGMPLARGSCATGSKVKSHSPLKCSAASSVPLLDYLTTYDKMRRTCLEFGHGRQGRAAARLLHCLFGSSVQPQIRRPKLPQSFVDTEYCLYRICFSAQICQAPAAEAPRLRPQSDSHAQWYLLLSPACSGDILIKSAPNPSK